MNISNTSLSVPMTRLECLSLAQCIHNAILATAKHDLASKFRLLNRSSGFDTFCLQKLAEEVAFMVNFYQLAGENFDKQILRQELLIALDDVETTAVSSINEKYVTLAEGAKLLRKSESTMKRWRSMGLFPDLFVKVGMAWYIDTTKLSSAGKTSSAVAKGN